MVYLLETQLPENKSIVMALTNVYGVGKQTSVRLCKQLGFSENLKVNELSGDQINNLLELITNKSLIITSDLKKQKTGILKKLVVMKSYKGLRQIQGFPSRGQRTHTNARNARKNKRKTLK